MHVSSDHAKTDTEVEAWPKALSSEAAIELPEVSSPGLRAAEPRKETQGSRRKNCSDRCDAQGEGEMIAVFTIVQVFASASTVERWPSHLCMLANGNSVLLRWNEIESPVSTSQWKPGVPKAGDNLLVNPDGLRIAAYSDWRLWR